MLLMPRTSHPGVRIDEVEEWRDFFVVIAADLDDEEITRMRILGDEHDQAPVVRDDSPAVRRHR